MFVPFFYVDLYMSSKDRCKNMSQRSKARKLTPRQKRDTHAVGRLQPLCQYTMIGDRWIVSRRADLVGRGILQTMDSIQCTSAT